MRSACGWQTRRFLVVDHVVEEGSDVLFVDLQQDDRLASCHEAISQVALGHVAKCLRNRCSDDPLGQVLVFVLVSWGRLAVDDLFLNVDVLAV